MTVETQSPPAAAAPPAPAPQKRTYPFTFTGEAREYFRIWIVNLFLSVVTLGIYSPWAKVRKKRYFYANTWLADANFDYHGNPVAILKGRIVAVLALIAYNVAGHYVPSLGTAVLLAAAVAAPWLILRTFQFNAVNSSYRNLRFHFVGKYSGGLLAIAPLLLVPLLMFVFPPLREGEIPRDGRDFARVLVPVLPIFLFYPYVMGALKRFHVANSAYGDVRFGFTGRIRSFYGIYFIAGFLFSVIVSVMGVAVGFLAMGIGVGWEVLPLLGYIGVVAIVFGYTRSRVTNLTFNSATLFGGHPFKSTLKARKLAVLYAGNVLGITLSLGLLVPWAVMRTARYRASCLSVECDGDIETLLAGVSAPSAAAVGATGEQLSEFFDLDLSL